MSRSFHPLTEFKWTNLTYEERLKKTLAVEWDPVVFGEDPYFLGQSFPRGMWPMQKDIIRRFELGIPKTWSVDAWMTARQEAFDHEHLDEWIVANRAYYTELDIAAGMRSSKTTLAGVLALLGAFQLLNLPNPGEHFKLRKGQELFIINVATSDDQAHDTIFAVESSLLAYSPYFLFHEPIPKYNEFRFRQKDFVIRCGGSNSGSLVGRTLYRALFDELTRFQDNNGRRSGFEVYNGLGRGVTSVRWPQMDPNEPRSQAGKKIAISSMMYSGDIIDQLVIMSDKIDTMLGYKLATWQMNPNLTEAALRDEFTKDPDKAWRDFGVQPGMNIEKYYRDPEVVVFDATRINPLLLYERTGTRIMEFIDTFMGNPALDYVLTGDPAVKMDSFGLCLAHRDKDMFVVDFVHRIRPEIEVDPNEVKWVVQQLKRRFNIRWMVIDQWSYPETLQELRNSGIQIEFNVVRKEQHDKLKECFYMKHISCYEFPHLKKELSELDVIRGQNVDHPRGGSKDVADAVAQACWKLMAVDEHRMAPSFRYVKKINRGVNLGYVGRPY